MKSNKLLRNKTNGLKYDRRRKTNKRVRIVRKKKVEMWWGDSVLRKLVKKIIFLN